MKAKVLSINSENPSIDDLLQIIELLNRGGTIVYPTDTVYGLGANALNPEAVLKIFEIKERPLNQPLPVAVSGLKMAETLADVDAIAKQLIDFFWPGALTIVLRKKDILPSVVTGGGDRIGLRAPQHVIPLSIIKLSNFPLVTTSANKHGLLPCIDALEVVNQLDGEVDLIIDGGRGKRRASTIIDLSSKTPLILRMGPISRMKIEERIGMRVEVLTND